MRRITLGVLAVLATLLLGGSLLEGTASAQEPGQAPTIASFRGSYTGFSTPLVLGPVPLHAGVVVLRARHGGNANFVVSMATQDEGKTPEDSYGNRYLLINSIGRFEGAAAEMLRQDGDYYILVSAGGAYEFQVEQPVPADVTPVSAREFSGEHQQVTPVFRLEAGTHTLHASSDGTGNFFVWLYQVDDLGGAAINGDYAGRLIAVTNGPAAETATVTLRRGGLYLIHVYASSIETPTSAAGWSIRIE